MILLKSLVLLNAILIVVFSIGAYMQIPDFENLFREFGAELPVITEVMLVSHILLPLLLPIPLLIYARYLRVEHIEDSVANNILVSNIFLLLFIISLIPIIIYAMYLPIFQMETV